MCKYFDFEFGFRVNLQLNTKSSTYFDEISSSFGLAFGAIKVSVAKHDQIPLISKQSQINRWKKKCHSMQRNKNKPKCCKKKKSFQKPICPNFFFVAARRTEACTHWDREHKKTLPTNGHISIESIHTSWASVKDVSCTNVRIRVVISNPHLDIGSRVPRFKKPVCKHTHTPEHRAWASNPKCFCSSVFYRLIQMCMRIQFFFSSQSSTIPYIFFSFLYIVCSKWLNHLLFVFRFRRRLVWIEKSCILCSAYTTLNGRRSQIENHII